MNNELYAQLARLVTARANCEASGNSKWHSKHTLRINELVSDYMPSGSGIDRGTMLDLDASTPNKLVFLTSYHHINDGGYYDSWTEHTVTVTPDLAFGFTLRIGGRDRNDIKSYLHDVFAEALGTVIETAPALPATAIDGGGQ